MNEERFSTFLYSILCKAVNIFTVIEKDKLCHWYTGSPGLLVHVQQNDQVPSLAVFQAIFADKKHEENYWYVVAKFHDRTPK